MSLSWGFNQPLSTTGNLSLVVGLVVIRALRAVSPALIQLKWPNDVIYQGKKLGGILIELQATATAYPRAIIGIGLNVKLPRELKAAITGTTALAITDLSSTTSRKHISRNSIVAAITAGLCRDLPHFAKHGFANYLNEWNQYDALIGKEIHVVRAKDVVKGIAQGVDASGALQVQTSNGLMAFYSGEVTVRPSNTNEAIN
jgi:BirA family transcriptional regulator, biotin operon repressor / biotin---[acetyl-CoA-carboxylase] ligase